MNIAHDDLPRILALLDSRDDASALEQILEPETWHVQFEWRFTEAEAAVSSSSFTVVICARCFDGGHQWTDVLASVTQTAISPLLIVVDPFADEALWAEVLNLGGYDVLMLPFDRNEVLRVLEQAGRFWKSARARRARRR